MIRRFRMWRFQRRLNSILDDAGLPRAARDVFTGKVLIKDVRLKERA